MSPHEDSGMARVVIAEDHYLVREGTRRLLESSGTIKVADAVPDGRRLVAAVEQCHPDAVITDIRMPPGHHTEGIDAAHAIRAAHPDCGVVVLSQYANPLYAFELFRNGTDHLAYLLKDRVGDRDELVAAIAAVIAGRSVIDPIVVDALIARGRTPTSPIATLTERELEILSHMAQGQSNRAIAATAHVSMSSVEKHINSVFTKLGLDRTDTGINRRVAAVLTFVRELTAPPDAPSWDELRSTNRPAEPR